MRLSAFSIADSYPDLPGSRPDRYAEIVELATVADDAGLDAFWVAEHHFHPGGVCPSPAVLLAAAGAKTQRIRLGVLVSVLPFHGPVEIAEQYALLDQLTGGRLNMGVGSGYISLEFEGFGVDPALKREMFDHHLRLILAAWRGEPVRADDARGAPVTLNVRPRQRPHPPVWIAVQRREAIPFVARWGTSIAMVPYATVHDLPELAEEIREYRAALPSGTVGSVSVALHLFAGEDVTPARPALQRYLDSRLATQSRFYQEKVAKEPWMATAEGIEATGFALFGSAKDVARRLRAFERAGVDEVLGIFDFGGLSLAQASGSIRELARELSSSG
ncbi:MAG: LLM class flavin-dependent oxidoreductase [Thermoplasmata archaeon]|nr:LLM class flavin-dependent oxidoreductase [Thermoplasmata archaeon]